MELSLKAEAEWSESRLTRQSYGKNSLNKKIVYRNRLTKKTS